MAMAPKKRRFANKRYFFKKMKSFFQDTFSPELFLTTFLHSQGCGRGRSCGRTAAEAAAESICRSVLVENHVRWGGLCWLHKELSKSNKEGSLQKMESLARLYELKQWLKQITRNCEKTWKSSRNCKFPIARSWESTWGVIFSRSFQKKCSRRPVISHFYEKSRFWFFFLIFFAIFLRVKDTK